MSPTDKEIEWAHCNSCGGNKKHQIVATRVQSGSEPIEGYADASISWETTYRMLECRGCESVILHRSHWFSEEPDESVVTYYPPATSRDLPRWKDGLPADIHELLKEIYSALHSNSRRLATMGARTVVDLVMLNQVGDQGRFHEKLDALEAAGHIGKKNRKFLEAALDAGHAAAHRGLAPTEKAVNSVMDIVESLLQSVYILESAATELAQSTPTRPKRPKNSE